ncbi:YceG family protein [Paraclostridium bifermentans]|uniref:YceG family protein n=1 Tax=Paraclostridium bifermentans TaxID=1490 RepID=UPI0034DEEA87
MSDSVVFEKIFSSQSDRGNYTPSKGYTSYFIANIGVVNEDLYNLEIFKTNYCINERNDVVLFSQSIASPSDFDMINYFKNSLLNYRGSIFDLNINIVNDKEINNRIKRAFDIFLKEENNEFANDRIKQNFIVKIMSWIKSYVGNINIDKSEAPKIIFYGQIKKHEFYLLLILGLAGFDILYLNPNSDSNIGLLKIEKYNVELTNNTSIDNVLSFEERVVLGEKVERSSIEKAFTVGAEASKRISEELLNDSGFIKPWQLQDRSIKNLLLSSTIDEVVIYWNQPIKLRPGFRFDKNIVQVPVFFSKINGIYNDTKEYMNFINSLRCCDEVFFIEYDDNINHFSKKFTKEAFSLSFVLNTEGKIDKKAILDDKNYSISTLNANQQNMILDKIEEVLISEIFLDGLNREDRIKGLYSALYMNRRFVHMINNFDYSLLNPKLIIYLGKSLVFDKEIVFLMVLLSKIGFDIVILTPGGENCIENIINNQLVDIHRLDKMVYDFKLSSLQEDESLFKKLFGKRSGFKWG